jgi:hypothetical protein
MPLSSWGKFSNDQLISKFLEIVQCGKGCDGGSRDPLEPGWEGMAVWGWESHRFPRMMMCESDSAQVR